MNRFAYSLFCDDIRNEVGNKVSFMGVYADILYVPRMPFVLSKFCIRASAITPADQPFKTLTVRLKYLDFEETTFVDEGELSSPTIDTKESIKYPGREEDGIEQVIIFQNFYVFSPFQIKEPGRFNVHFDTEAGELKAGGITIRTP